MFEHKYKSSAWERCRARERERERERVGFVKKKGILDYNLFVPIKEKH